MSYSSRALQPDLHLTFLGFCLSPFPLCSSPECFTHPVPSHMRLFNILICCCLSSGSCKSLNRKIVNANFCQHLPVREQGRGGEKDGGMEDLEKQTRVDLLCGKSIQILYLSKSINTTVYKWSITSPALKIKLGYRKLKSRSTLL